eukprot:m.1638637 g.1638637  ORF g.1638637 m.1638637 type:complete len:236 (+) comp29494_c0_seq1:324-1031(+)
MMSSGKSDNVEYVYAGSAGEQGQLGTQLLSSSNVDPRVAIIKGADNDSTCGVDCFTRKMEIRHKPGAVALEYRFENGYICCPATAVTEGRLLLSNISMINYSRFSSNAKLYLAILLFMSSVLVFLLYGTGVNSSTDDDDFGPPGGTRSKKSVGLAVFGAVLLLQAVAFLVMFFLRKTSVQVKVFQAGTALLPSVSLAYESRDQLKSIRDNVDLITDRIHHLRQSEFNTNLDISAV